VRIMLIVKIQIWSEVLEIDMAGRDGCKGVGCVVALVMLGPEPSGTSLLHWDAHHDMLPTTY
jgi:hypothetical protein